MSFLGGGGAKGPKPPDYTGVPIQTSTSNLPIAVSYGTVKVSGNLVWYSDFKKTAAQTSGGKGGGGKGGGQYNYSAAIMLALGEGPATFVKCSTDGISWESLSQTGFGLIGGNVPQTAWSFLTSKYPSMALTYPGIVLLVNEQYQMGGSPQLPSLQMVCQFPGSGTASWASSGEFSVCDMAVMVEDILTNPRYGVPDFPSSAVGTATLLSTSAATGAGDSNFQTYCQANGWGFTARLDSTETALSVLQRWMMATNSEAIWSGSAIKWIPYGDMAITANGVTFLPDLTPIYSLDDDDFISDSTSDPVQISRADPADIPNIIRVGVTNNDGYYSDYLCEARDQAAIEAVGERVGSDITAKEILNPTQGTQLANLILQRKLGTRNTYTWKCDWTKCLLEPMDIVELNDPNLGLVNYAVRITEVSEDDQCILTFVAEDFPQGLAGPVEYPSQVTDTYVNNRAITAAPINPPIIFEPPAPLTAGIAQVWLCLSGGTAGAADPFWGGAVGYVSADNVTYIPFGMVTEPTPMGYLTATLASYSGANPDNTNTLYVSLAESDGELISATSMAAAGGQTMCYVGGELIGYTTATLTGANTYALTGLYRGMAGTTIGSHASGIQFARTDSSILIYEVPDYWLGVTLYFKATSFNVWNLGYQDISACTAYTYTPSGVAFVIGAPGSPTITPGRTLQADGSTVITLGFSWSASAGPLLGGYNVEWSTDGGATWPGTASTGPTALSYQFKPAVPGTNYLLRVQAVSQNGLAVSTWSVSASTNSGTLILSVPAAPYPLTATPTTSGTVVIGWPAGVSSDAVLSYQVYRASGTGAAFSSASLVWSGLATSYTDAGLTNGASYTYFVTATNSLGTSGEYSINATATNVTGTGAFTIQGFFYGAIPSGMLGVTLYQQTITSAAITFDAGLPGSNFTLGTVSASPTPCVIRVNKNGTQVGTITFAAGSLTPTVSFTSGVTYAMGDIFSLTTGTNNGGSYFGYTFVGHA